MRPWSSLHPAAADQLRTHLDCQSASHVEEQRDPLPGDFMLDDILRHLFETFPPGAAAPSHSVYCTGNRQRGRVRGRADATWAPWSAEDLLSELRVVFDSVADDANHFGQLDHHLAVLVRVHTQRGQRRDVRGGGVPQLLLDDPAVQTAVKTSGAFVKSM